MHIYLPRLTFQSYNRCQKTLFSYTYAHCLPYAYLAHSLPINLDSLPFKSANCVCFRYESTK